MEEFTKIIKNLFREKINFVILLLAAILSLNIYSFIFEAGNFEKIRKKVDHRYFNTTRSLEQIHNVKINTFDGELKPIRL